MNLSVSVKPDGYLVSWDSPEYGKEMLGLYVVRWYLEPEHRLHGKAETTNNFYLGECLVASWNQKLLKFCILVPDEALTDGVLYRFQVSSVSSNNYEAFSSEFEIVTPHYRIVQAITIGAVILLALLALSLLLFYVKRHLFTPTNGESKV